MRQIGAAIPKRIGEFRAALAVFRRKMEAGADKTESQLAEGKHTFLKKVDENFPAIILIKNASRRGLHFLLQINYQKSDKRDRDADS